MDEEEHREALRAQKKKDAKLNNSFTGPYPQDPTEFNHNDKGANAQFLHYIRQTEKAAAEAAK